MIGCGVWCVHQAALVQDFTRAMGAYCLLGEVNYINNTKTESSSVSPKGNLQQLENQLDTMLEILSH